LTDCFVISDVNKTLAELVWNNIKDDKQISSVLSTENQISFSSPKLTENEGSKKITFFLYQITEFSSMRNHPMLKGNQNQEVHRSLHLIFHYLITPYTQNTESNHILLGKILQIFANNAVLRGSLLKGGLSKNPTALRLALDPLSIDELNRLWSVIGANYRLSLSYSVYPVFIEMAPRKEMPRVVEEKTGFKCTQG
jgi:hypothetical protein